MQEMLTATAARVKGHDAARTRPRDHRGTTPGAGHRDCHGTRARFGPAFATCLVASLVAPVNLSAQPLLGTVLDARQGAGVAAALVQIIAADSSVLASVATDERGAFRILYDRALGTYLRVARNGYGEVREPLALLLSDRSTIEVRLEPAPERLPALMVEAESRNRFLQGVGFYDRQRAGLGTFITREMLADRYATARTAGDVLRAQRGLLVREQQDHDLILVLRSMGRMGGLCPARVYLNGIDQEHRLEHMLPDNIEAIEVFRGPADVPPRFGGAYGACGVVLVWLRSGQS
jgi:hypothetical protein